MSLRKDKCWQTYVNSQSTEILNYLIAICLYGIHVGFLLTLGKNIFFSHHKGMMDQIHEAEGTDWNA